MAKNYMADVAKLLGIELEEEFKLTGHSGTFVLTNKGIMWLAPDKRRSSEVFALEDSVTGRNELVRLPWQPTKGHEYFKPGRDFTNAVIEIWENTAFETSPQKKRVWFLKPKKNVKLLCLHCERSI